MERPFFLQPVFAHEPQLPRASRLHRHPGTSKHEPRGRAPRHFPIGDESRRPRPRAVARRRAFPPNAARPEADRGGAAPLRADARARPRHRPRGRSCPGGGTSSPRGADRLRGPAYALSALPPRADRIRRARARPPFGFSRAPSGSPKRPSARARLSSGPRFFRFDAPRASASCRSDASDASLR